MGAQIMFMEAPNYWLMCISRFLSGMSSTVVWSLGLALLYDTALFNAAITDIRIGVILYRKHNWAVRRSQFSYSLANLIKTQGQLGLAMSGLSIGCIMFLKRFLEA
jgi:hypothetical protein